MQRLSNEGYDTDKSEMLLRYYENYLRPLADKDIRLLELGVYRGGSLLLWRDYFKNGTVVGVDVAPCQIEDLTGRIFLYQGFQQDLEFLDKVGQETAPDGFDIIIDDASHMGELTGISFWHLFDNHLKPGGIYCIEDWRTGYWDDWVDGKKYRFLSHQHTFLEKVIARVLRHKRKFPSHLYGMVGLIKQLVDELGMDAITDPTHRFAGKPCYPKFRRMGITPGQVFIVKANDIDRNLMIAHRQKYWAKWKTEIPCPQTNQEVSNPSN